tara:strand:+ start:411 stop:1157 length:747 start_codon:yes stop_codon:yes gene_type:complete
MIFKNISIKFLKFIKLLINKTTRRGLYYNIAASIELEELIKNLNINMIIDIGSNKGQFILILDKFFKNIKVLSFEPISEVLKKQKKFFASRENITFFNFALGSSNSETILNITRKKDSSSILQIANENLLGRNFDIIEKRQISVKTLESALRNIKLKDSILLKLDVQGYEFEVLKGAENLLPKIKYIITEVAKNQIYKNQVAENIVIKYLKERNFEIIKTANLFKIKNTNYLQKDILFINKLLINDDK